MRSGQLIEYNMIKVFLEKSYIKCDKETVPRPFSKKLKLSISLCQYSKVVYSLFLLHAKLRAVEILQQSCTPLAFTSHKDFSKIKKSGLELVSLPHFLHDF